MKSISDKDIDELIDLIDDRLLLVTGRESEEDAWRELEVLLGVLDGVEGKIDDIIGGE